MAAKPTGERLAVLETDMNNVKGDVASIKTQVGEMHEVLMQAKGARWVIVVSATIVAFITGVASRWVPFPLFPR